MFWYSVKYSSNSWIEYLSESKDNKEISYFFPSSLIKWYIGSVAPTVFEGISWHINSILSMLFTSPYSFRINIQYSVRDIFPI